MSKELSFLDCITIDSMSQDILPKIIKGTDETSVPFYITLLNLKIIVSYAISFSLHISYKIH